MAKFLEINVISAQDLPQVCKPLEAYAVAWLHPDRKLTTQVDQDGHTNPTWNEKFVFRVDDHFLNSDNSVIMIEIYAQAWLQPILIGTVRVFASNLLPANRKPKLRFFELQIRRPSGRPQGILNIGAILLDSTMRRMPLCSELSSSSVSHHDLMESRKNKNRITEEDSDKQSLLDSSLLTLQRSQSEINDSTINGYAYHGNAKHCAYDEQDSEVGVRKGGFFNEDSLISDQRPSPSMVAAAISKGLYPMPPPRTAESSTVDGWSEITGTEEMKKKLEMWKTELSPASEDYDDEWRKLESSTVDGWSENTGTEEMKKKLEMWKMELSPALEDYDEERRKLKQTSKRLGQTPRRGARRGEPSSCFGTVFGCEITITCSRGNQRRKNRGAKGCLKRASSELTYDKSYM
ncbi:unnamed protein product [Sphenostylis stenocarpa]|uniref:C2 domain-containing protein n=1 Tax=Sphenostylis stenocarpa TaxID=92480 RepID=A0AA86VZ58_9FABA|nr:unnamed protein product [Sphenostylis stenocarpa]